MILPPGAAGIVAAVLDAPVMGTLRFRPDSLVVHGEGAITAVIAPDAPERDAAIDELAGAGRLERLPAETLLLPGLIDLHNHAPQWPQLGKALDVPLETWLNEYTFPLEARYEDIEFASHVYQSLVPAMIANGEGRNTLNADDNLAFYGQLAVNPSGEYG